jgi:chaperonin GroES
MAKKENGKLALRPLDDRIVVKRVEAEDKTAGGIILPDNAKEKPQKGEVVAVGLGKLLDSGARATPDVKAGDLVLFGKYSGTEVKVEGVDYLIMREGDILAKF